MFPDRHPELSDPACSRGWRGFRSLRGGRCRGAFRAGIPARIAGRASNSPSIGNTCRETTCGGSIGGRMAGRIGSSSRSSRPTPTCGAAWWSIPAGRWGLARPGCSKLEYARRIAGALGHLALQQGDAVGLSCVAGGIVRNIPPKRNPSHLMTVFDVLEQTQPQGQTQLVPVLHELAETISQRALVVIISDLFVEPAELALAASSTCGSASTTRRSSICSIRRSSGFDFRRPMRFLDMEGGPSIFAEPNEIADRYQKALVGLSRRTCSRWSWNPPSITTGSRSTRTYEQVLIRFLVGRTRSKGVR